MQVSHPSSEEALGEASAVYAASMQRLVQKVEARVEVACTKAKKAGAKKAKKAEAKKAKKAAREAKEAKKADREAKKAKEPHDMTPRMSILAFARSPFFGKQIDK